MLLTKFHQPQTKTSCLRGDIVDCTKERKSLDSRQWKRKDWTFLRTPRELLLSSGRPRCLWRTSGSSSRCMRGPWGVSWALLRHLQRTLCWGWTTSSTWRTWWSRCRGGCRPSLMAMATSPSTSLSSCTTMGPFQGQNHINKRFINLFLMDWPGLFAHTV